MPLSDVSWKGGAMKRLMITALLTTGMANAAELEAKQDGVQVFSDTSKKSVVATLRKGQKVESGERKGMYWPVTVDGKAGFVSVMVVQTSSSRSGSSVTDAILDAVKQGRQADDPGNNRARSTVMGVRGLDDTSDSAFAGNVKPNLRMVYSMEDLVVSRDDLRSLESSIQQEIESLSTKRN